MSEVDVSVDIEQRNKDILALYDKGMRLGDICDLYKLPVTRVWSLLRSSGRVIIGVGGQITWDQIQALQVTGRTSPGRGNHLLD